MTHFKPSEIGITAEKARELGYDVQHDDEVVELKPQDVVIPMNLHRRAIQHYKVS